MEDIQTLTREKVKLDEPGQANEIFYSKSNSMFIKLRAYKPYVYTGFSMSYKAVGKQNGNLIVKVIV